MNVLKKRKYLVSSKDICFDDMDTPKNLLIKTAELSGNLAYYRSKHFLYLRKMFKI
jgi:hypothetical protein